MSFYSQLHWKLIGLLSCIALIRPLMSMLGLLDLIGQPFASVGITILISIVWIITIIFKKDPFPLLTLLMVGVVYGLLAIFISGILSPILTDHLQGPLTNPFAIISVLATNAIWGLIVGLISLLFVKKKRTQKEEVDK